jgi:hypothetical protein
MLKYEYNQQDMLISGKSKNLSFTACEPFFIGCAKLSGYEKTAIPKAFMNRRLKNSSGTGSRGALHGEQADKKAG